jgi:murein DD-endopeptidase MepM/ murein hydrolase activator NlpD
MKYWPIQNYSSKNIPREGQGSFSEDRGDRKHCGVDIYASRGSRVIAIEDGIVIAKWIFTSPKTNPYWNITYFVAIKHKSGNISKYCELEDVIVLEGTKVEGGQIIGHVGDVLNLELIDQNSPDYIQKIKASGIKSMLHFELYSIEPFILENYSGGNFFGDTMPHNLLDPTEYLLAI